LPRHPFRAAGQCPGELEQAAAQSRIVDPVIGADQLDRFTPMQRIESNASAAGSTNPAGIAGARTGSMSSKKKETGTSRTRLRSCNRLAPIRLAPRSYFWTC
jgi:hypothetical protein